MALCTLLIGASVQATDQAGMSGGPATDSVCIEAIPAAASTWGYDVFLNGRRYIHQPFVPGRSGNAGFSTRQRAEAAAGIVREKILRGIRPPTITLDELRAANLID